RPAGRPGDHRPLGLHGANRSRPLGGPDPRPRHRGPGLHGGRRADRLRAAPLPQLRALDDRRPVGRRHDSGRGYGVLRLGRPRLPHPERDAREPALAAAPPPAGLPLARERDLERGRGLGRRAHHRHRSALMAQSPAPDKRRAILDAAITVFARQGFHSARVSDVAAEAGVASGLVYHYFDSKDQMLNELFSERWALLVEASREVRRSDAPPREKLAGVANFIIESYRHEPELMKVIIVEVTRAANSFGRTHLPEIRQAYELVAEIVSDAQEAGEFRDDVDPNFAAMVFYGAIEQLLTGWIFGSIPGTDEDMERAKQLVVETICDGLEPRPVGDAVA